MFALQRKVLVSLLAASISLAGMTPAIAQSEGGATDLSVEAACNAIEPGTWAATFQWRLDKRHQGVELDITEYYRGFETERFETIAKLESAEPRFDWSGGDPGAEYSWRVRAMIDGRWLVSETARYEVPVCPVDMVRPEDNEVPGIDPAPER
jgi:hypothetical protein